jgi:hypothetical protein
VKGEAGQSASTKLQVVLKETLGFFTFTNVCQVLNGYKAGPPEDIAPEKIASLKYASVTSFVVERSCSAYKHILSDKGQSMTPENMEKDSKCVLCTKNP